MLSYKKFLSFQLYVKYSFSENMILEIYKYSLGERSSITMQLQSECNGKNPIFTLLKLGLPRSSKIISRNSRLRGSRREANAESKEDPRTPSRSRSRAHPNVGVRNWAWDASKEPGPKTSTFSDPKQKQKTNPLRKKNKLNMHPMNSDLKVVSQNIQEKKLLREIEEITNSFRQPKTDFR